MENTEANDYFDRVDRGIDREIPRDNIDLSRVSSIIQNDPELRELNKTNRQEAILQAKIRIFENAETEEVPLTSDFKAFRR